MQDRTVTPEGAGFIPHQPGNRAAEHEGSRQRQSQFFSFERNSHGYERSGQNEQRQLESVPPRLPFQQDTVEKKSARKRECIIEQRARQGVSAYRQGDTGQDGKNQMQPIAGMVFIQGCFAGRKDLPVQSCRRVRESNIKEFVHRRNTPELEIVDGGKRRPGMRGDIPGKVRDGYPAGEAVIGDLFSVRSQGVPP